MAIVNNYVELLEALIYHERVDTWSNYLYKPLYTTLKHHLYVNSRMFPFQPADAVLLGDLLTDLCDLQLLGRNKQRLNDVGKTWWKTTFYGGSMGLFMGFNGV